MTKFRHASQTPNHSASGFTLVEILVVLSVTAIVSSITVAGFSSIRTGNQKTSCQTNLTQIYQACRLYGQDFDGRFPYYNPNVITGQPNIPEVGIGLWSLYAFADNTDYDAISPVTSGTPTATYLRSAKVFHCPADKLPANRELRLPNGNFNPAYLSYQYKDDGNIYTYSSVREAGEPRQLNPISGTAPISRPPADITVVTWCRWHRKLDSSGITLPGRNYDNVLFMDGTIQWLPMDQQVTEVATSTSDTCKAWQRVPREQAEQVPNTSFCDLP